MLFILLVFCVVRFCFAFLGRGSMLLILLVFCVVFLGVYVAHLVTLLCCVLFLCFFGGV